MILAGGNGTRLDPLTRVTNKHLLPIYDRPMIFYPIETLRDMGIREVMVIARRPEHRRHRRAARRRSDFGLDLTYRYQRGAQGIAHAIGLARDFVGSDSFCAVLGDNILRGESLKDDRAPLRRRAVGRRRAPLSRARCAALWRRRVRRRAPGRFRGEATRAQERPDPDRRLFPAPGCVRRHRHA